MIDDVNQTYDTYQQNKKVRDLKMKSLMASRDERGSISEFDPKLRRNGRKSMIATKETWNGISTPSRTFINQSNKMRNSYLGLNQLSDSVNRKSSAKIERKHRRVKSQSTLNTMKKEVSTAHKSQYNTPVKTRKFKHRNFSLSSTPNLAKLSPPKTYLGQNMRNFLFEDQSLKKLRESSKVVKKPAIAEFFEELFMNDKLWEKSKKLITLSKIAKSMSKEERFKWNWKKLQKKSSQKKKTKF